MQFKTFHSLCYHTLKNMVIVRVIFGAFIFYFSLVFNILEA